MLKNIFNRIIIIIRKFISLIKTTEGQKSIARDFDSFFLDANKAESRIKSSISSANNISSIVQFIASIGLMRFIQISLSKIDTGDSIIDRASIIVLSGAIMLCLVYSIIILNLLIFDYIVFYISKYSSPRRCGVFRMEYIFLIIYVALYFIALSGMDFVVNSIAMSMF